MGSITRRAGRRAKSCSSTSTAGSRDATRSNCPRRATNASAARNCGAWFCSLKSLVGVSTFCETEGSGSLYRIPRDGLFDEGLRTATSLAVWSIFGEQVVAWLMRNNLHVCVLGDGCVLLERTYPKIRATVWVRKEGSAVMVRISERILNESQLQRLRRKIPCAYNELMRCGWVRVNFPRRQQDSGNEREPQH